VRGDSSRGRDAGGLFAMPSMKCHQCGKVKRCRMHTDRVEEQTIIVYLCAPCARSLGR